MVKNKELDKLEREERDELDRIREISDDFNDWQTKIGRRYSEGGGFTFIDNGDRVNYNRYT